MSSRHSTNIEKKREELYSMCRKSTFSDRGVLEKSRELDVLIKEYYARNKRRK